MAWPLKFIVGLTYKKMNLLQLAFKLIQMDLTIARFARQLGEMDLEATDTH